jgi:hypothetical protein
MSTSSNRLIQAITNTQGNVLTISKKKNTCRKRRYKVNNRTKKSSKLSEKEERNSNSVIMTTLSSQLTQRKYLPAIMPGFTMYARFGFLSAISNRKMELSASKVLRILRRRDSSMNALFVKKTNVVHP